MITLEARTAAGVYPVILGEGVLAEAGGMWSRMGAGAKVVIITDANVAPLYLGPVEASFADAGVRTGTIVVEPGEGSKSLRQAEAIYSRMHGMKIRRGDAVCALGGGIVGDLAGFIASTYMRGIDVIQIPTTLLAQVDSSVGGKTGVNIPEAKNYVGTFHQPVMVLADPAVLSSLPGDQVREGLAEVIKYALLEGGGFFEELEANREKLLPVQTGYLTGVIRRCLLYKIRVVEEDELEKGLRAVLNLGHTVGHGIEAAGGFKAYSHGQAVALGLLAAVRLSEELTGLAPGFQERLQSLIAAVGLPVRCRDLRPDDIIAAMQADKKADDRSLNMVLLRRPGEPVTGCDVAADRLKSAVEALSGEVGDG